MDEDSLLEYYEVCARSSHSDQDGGSPLPYGSSSEDEERGQSPWRATSGDSPLRGRARLRSPKQRNSLMELKRKGNQHDGEREHDSTIPCRETAVAYQQYRGQDARRVAAWLADPFGLRRAQPRGGEDAIQEAMKAASTIPAAATPPTTTTTLAAAASRGSSSPSAYRTAQDLQQAEQQADEAIRDAFVFDVLCALRQEQTRYCCCRVRQPKSPPSQQQQRDVAATAGDEAHRPGATAMAPSRYALRHDARAFLLRRGWFAFVAALEQILATASRVAALQDEIESFHDTVQEIGREVDISALVGSALRDGDAAQGSSVHATMALGEAAFSSLFRFGVFARNAVRGFRSWVLEVQELTADYRSRRETDKGGDGSGCAAQTECCPDAESGTLRRKVQRTETGEAQQVSPGRKGRWANPNLPFSFGPEQASPADGFTTSPPALLPLLEAIEHNAIPLERLLLILRESECFSGLRVWAEAHRRAPTRTPPLPPSPGQASDGVRAIIATSFDFADQCAALGAGLLDYLIIRLSALQDTSTMDLYRVHMVLLLHCAWPYVLLTTAAICGLVHSLDPHRWRRQLPRLFRSSFSHIRVGDGKRRYPTDVLSLLLNCVGYDTDGPMADGNGSAASALASSRRFILRCFATFARKTNKNRTRKGQQRVSTTVPPPPVATTDAAAGLQGGGSEQARTRAAQADIANVRNMSVAEVLAELVRDAEGDEGQQPWEPLFLPPHVLKERQRRRNGQWGGERDAAGDGTSTSTAPTTAAMLSEVTTETSVVATFPPAIPLGFATVDAEVPGQAAYRRAVRHRQLVNDLPICSSSPSLAEGELDDDDDDDNSHERRSGRTTRSHRGGGALWHLRISDSDAVPDLQLVNRNDRTRAGGEAKAAASHRHGSAQALSRGVGARERDLWLNTTIPAARWIAAALLIPIGVVVQRLHERRAERLFRRTLLQRSVPLTPFDLDTYDDDDSAPDAVGGGGVCATAVRVAGAEGRVLSAGEERRRLLQQQTTTRAAGCRPHPTLLLSQHTAPASFSLLRAVRLLLDVALCRDKPRILEGFLEKLFREPHWWHRTRSTAAPSSPVAAAETSSRLISSLFAEALRGKRFGDLVTLSVLPRAGDEEDRETNRGRGNGEDGDGDLLLPWEMLSVFASFKLHFAFPDELALLLLPAELCVAVRPSTGCGEAWEDQVEPVYSALFWERRRGRCTGGEQQDATTTTTEPEASSASAAHGATSPRLPFSDVWSYAFGYLCALHFAQITLREQRKALHIRDTQDHELLSVLGAEKRATAPAAPLPPERKVRKESRPAARAATAAAAAALALSRRAPLAMVSRGLGSAYYSLSFVADALLSFTLREASAVIYRLERMLASTEALGSLMELCQGLDTLLLQLRVVCFPALPPVPTSASAVAGTVTEEEVRRSVNTILALSLDPNRMPVKLLASRSRVAVEGLVALVSGLSDASVLKTRLHPLLVLLTFNGFFGWEGQANYQFR